MSEPNLEASDFAIYPPEAHCLAVAQVDLLREMPAALLASTLREVRGYALLFPAEQKRVQAQFNYLRSLDVSQRTRVFAPFLAIDAPVNDGPAAIAADPDGFLERYTAVLWSSGQLDSFREAARKFVDDFAARAVPHPLPVPRLTVVAIGAQATDIGYPLFRKLRPYGMWFPSVRDADGSQVLMDLLASRTRDSPMSYAHWYVDGAAGWPVLSGSSPLIVRLSYAALDPMRRQTLAYMDRAVRDGWGPEKLRNRLMHLDPVDSNPDPIADTRLHAFASAIFTQGSGTQLFSTTFVQWTTRELLRRAEPLTTIARYAPRQPQRPLNALFNPLARAESLDANGALIDADMGAWYTFLEMSNLPGSDQAVFLAWCESRHESLLIGPATPKGQTNPTSADLGTILQDALAASPNAPSAASEPVFMRKPDL